MQECADINALADEIYADNVAAGWWDGYLPDTQQRRV